MMATIKANKGNYGSKRNVSNIKYIVVHYTANDGDHDESNANYFKNNVVKASAHYFVDSDSITQSVPDDYTAWSVGGKKYSNCCITGGGKYYGKCTNGNSISIELCDDIKNGVIYPSAKTIDNAIELTKNIMKKYGIDAGHVIRHFDVNGKNCPAYWCGTAEKNKKWLTEFKDKLGATTASATVKQSESSYKVKVTTDVLNVRAGAGTNYKINMAVKRGEVYTIVEESGGWGKLKSKSGWINLEYTVKC